MRRRSYVYFIGCQDTGGELRVKIGFTSRTPLARLLDFQPGSPQELDVLCYVEGDMALERRLHAAFDGCRLHGEWFLSTGCLDRLIRRLMRDGNGARNPTPWDMFKLALFECAYDAFPDRVLSEPDWHTYEITCDPTPLDPYFEREYCREHWVRAE